MVKPWIIGRMICGVNSLPQVDPCQSPACRFKPTGGNINHFCLYRQSIAERRGDNERAQIWLTRPDLFVEQPAHDGLASASIGAKRCRMVGCGSMMS